MVFNHTSCGKSARRGFTLVEYLFATSLGLIVLAVGVVFWAYASRTCASLSCYVDLVNTSKNAFDRMGQEIRNAKAVKSCSANQLVLIMTNAQQLTYTYDSSGKILVKTIGSAKTTLLKECTNFSFSVYQRTPISNSFNLYTNGWATNTAKVVQMNWTCSRKLTGDKSAVETQLSSKIVIRNQ